MKGAETGSDRTADRSCQRQGQPNEIMGRISDRCLVHVPDRDLDPAPDVGYWPEIAEMNSLRKSKSAAKV